MFEKASLPRAACIHGFWLVLSLAGMLGVSALHAQTVSADFGNRSGSTPVVPTGIFSAGGTGTAPVNSQSTIGLFTAAGIDRTRIWIALDQVYATSTANFSYLDYSLQTISNAGLHPLGVIYNTPPSLGWSSCGAPSDYWQWGQMAASVVAHVDQKFPGLMQDYEIWNEPELQGSLCTGSVTSNLSAYVSMFAAAGQAMHTQATADGQVIHVGGPVISQLSQAPTWIPALLNNGSTEPYVDFVSFHLYITGQNNIDSGMDWSQLYSITQGSRGVAYFYQMIEPYVRAGYQRNAATTPIYITEYNTNWAYSTDCCRNNPTYGPLWNSLAIADFLNVVYSGATAVPSQLSYFAAAGSYFCLVGEWDWDMDCNSAQLTPYPQFYALDLFASPQFLNLQAGGHMAASVSPATTTSGLDATAFYTNSADSVVIVNPTANYYGTVNVSLANLGFSATGGTQYLLNSSNAQITNQSVALTPVSGGYSAQVAVPAYSTVAIAVASGQSGSSGGSSGSSGGSGSSSGGGSGAPTAVISVTPQAAALEILANSSQSTGGGSAIVGRTIFFGDGTWASWQPTAYHTYAAPGQYTVVVTIKNQSGQTSSASTTVTVSSSSGGGCYLCG
jgi:hypothetical protein